MITYNTLPADICSVAKERTVAVRKNNAVVVLETFLVSRRWVGVAGRGAAVVARQQVHREEDLVLRTCQVQGSHCYVISGNVDN